LGGAERQQLLFIRYVRPAAAAVSLVLFTVYELVSPARRTEWLIVLLAVALVVALLDIFALRRWPVGVVARATLALDMVLIGTMIAVLDVSALLVVPYFAPVAVAALLFGPLETVLYTAMGAVGGIVVAPLIGANVPTVIANILVLAVTGAILAAISLEARRAQADLTTERVRDSTALDIAERIRYSASVEEVLRPAVEALGRATGSARCLLRLAPRPDGTAPVFEWDADGVPPAALDFPPAPIRRVLESGEPLVIVNSASAEPELKQFAESRRCASLVAYPIFWQDAVIGVLGFTDDHARDWRKDALPLIERVAPLLAAAVAQAQLVEEQETTLGLREELIANVSHELRTPLTSTIGFLQTLDRGDLELSAEERTQLLSVARREAERLAVLVEDLLQLARLERGELPLEKTEIDLTSLVHHAVRGIEVPTVREIEVPDDDVLVHVDPGRILQVLQNLLTNSIRHGQGRVRVIYEREPTIIRLLVTDEGSGVPEEREPDLFVPFARTTARGDSSGLGLAISRRIAEAHGGSLVYRPPGNGRPHAFVMALPL
jgi:signal transduction histidine kinase